MRGAIDEMAAGLASQERYIDADLRFHVAVAAATRNRIALRMMDAIRDLLHRALASIYHIPGSPERSITQYREILEAMLAKDWKGAARALSHHIRTNHPILSRIVPRAQRKANGHGDAPARSQR